MHAHACTHILTYANPYRHAPAHTHTSRLLAINTLSLNDSYQCLRHSLVYQPSLTPPHCSLLHSPHRPLYPLPPHCSLIHSPHRMLYPLPPPTLLHSHHRLLYPLPPPCSLLHSPHRTLYLLPLLLVTLTTQDALPTPTSLLLDTLTPQAALPTPTPLLLVTLTTQNALPTPT